MVDWAKSPDYPTKRGNCDVCGKRDTVKLAFDRVRYICISPKGCLARWSKENQRRKEQDG